MELAAAIGAENNVLADIRSLFSVKHSCLWDKQTGEDEIRKLLTEYSVVKESNAILNTTAHSLSETCKEWRDRLKFIGIPCEALRTKYPALVQIFDTLLKIFKHEDILPEQLKILHAELVVYRAGIRDLLNNDRRIFSDVYEHYLEDLQLAEAEYNAGGSDKYYLSAIDELKICGLDFVPMSGFCGGDDKIPDIERFLLVSDHGASRLAVLRRKEEKYDTDTSGEHSGRCYKVF